MRRSVMLLAVATLAGCGGDDGNGNGGGDAAQAPRAAISPVPTVFGGVMKPGVTYTTTAFRPRLQITLPPAEWKVLSADKPTSVELEPETDHPVSGSGISFYNGVRVFDAAKGGRIPGDAVDPPPDFAAWLTSHPHLKTTQPRPTEALGLKGVVIDVRVKSAQPRQYRDCGKVAGKCVVMMLGGIEPLVYGSETRARWLVLDLDGGGQLLVEEWAQPAKVFSSQLELLDRVVAGARLVR